MKNVLFALALVFTGLTAFADVPPRPGTVVTAKVEQSAAQILYNSLEEEVTNLPTEYALPINCQAGNRTLTQGKLHTSRDGKIVIACSTYYCYGHNAVCTLKQTY